MLGDNDGDAGHKLKFGEYGSYVNGVYQLLVAPLRKRFIRLSFLDCITQCVSVSKKLSQVTLEIRVPEVSMATVCTNQLYMDLL